MRYKTLFRILLKAMGVFFFIQGISSVISHSYFVAELWISKAPDQSVWRIILRDVGGYFVSNCLEAAIGLYLLFGGKWIVNKAIRGNRPYCHECGYDLTQNVTGTCPECGTASPIPQRAAPVPPPRPPSSFKGPMRHSPRAAPVSPPPPLGGGAG